MTRALLIDPGRTLQPALAATPALAGVHLESAVGEADALGRLRRHSYGALVSSPLTSLSHDLPLLDEVRHIRPGVRVILLAPAATPEEILTALRQRVFACFMAPFDMCAVADMLKRAVEADDWQDGIEVISAKRDWVALRMACRLLTAERLVHYLSQLPTDIPDAERDQLIGGFREVLLNAMEHGAGFDPEQVIEVAAIRTERAIVYYVRDPGAGFSPDRLPHSALSNPPDDPIAHLEVRAQLGLRPGGFGLLVARQVVDEMIHSEVANEVLMIKRTL